MPAAPPPPPSPPTDVDAEPANAELAALDAEQRQVIAEIWLGRAAGERGSTETFRVVAASLAALDAEPALIALARRAVDDELRHAARCLELACRYAGRALVEPGPPRPELPRYDAAPGAVRHALHVVGQCCLNETTASAFLERCLLHATSAPVRATFRALLADEVDHARLGWAYLASPRLSPDLRAAIAAYLPSLIATNLRSWRARPTVPADPIFATHGVLPWATVDEAVLAARDELILPGLRHVGIHLCAPSSPQPSSARQG
jgi:hypothetical protein